MRRHRRQSALRSRLPVATPRTATPNTPVFEVHPTEYPVTPSDEISEHTLDDFDWDPSLTDAENSAASHAGYMADEDDPEDVNRSPFNASNTTPQSEAIPTNTTPTIATGESSHHPLELIVLLKFPYIGRTGKDKAQPEDRNMLAIPYSAEIESLQPGLFTQLTHAIRKVVEKSQSVVPKSLAALWALLSQPFNFSLTRKLILAEPSFCARGVL